MFGQPYSSKRGILGSVQFSAYHDTTVAQGFAVNSGAVGILDLENIALTWKW